MKKYYGMYVGIVVQNDDPEHRGRLKVFVPHVNPTLYQNWNQTAKSSDKNFIFPDKFTNPDLDAILETLKNTLPWADCAAPLFGGSASGRYNAFTSKGSTSDSTTWEDGKYVEGNRPLQNYMSENPHFDSFSSVNDKTKNRFVNPYSSQYTPSNYSNLARGLFTIPNVGAHVWVFFNDGDPIYPVYFAVSHNKEDWNRIYSSSQNADDIYEKDKEGNLKISNTKFTSVDYPDAYENLDATVKDSKLDGNTKTFRSKSVLNSNKHTLEFVDTDQHEILKMTHFSGSFKEFTNFANIEFATNNDQKMVINDQFLTVGKNQSIWISKARELIIAQDSYRTIGISTSDDASKVTKILKEIHLYKQLFDVKRTTFIGYGTSSLQEMKGSFANCPTCGGQSYRLSSHSIQNYYNAVVDPSWSDITDCERTLDPQWVIGFMTIDNIVDALENKLNEAAGSIGFYLGNRCDTCLRSQNGIVTTGLSPSTEDGDWDIDSRREDIGKLIKDKTKELYEAEKLLGEGDEIIEITKNKIENIGLVMNDMDPFRVDPIGKLGFNGVHTAIEGTYPTYKASQLIEYVDVDDVPGGDYNLTVSNKFKLLVGARGINIKTFGALDMYAPIINIAGQQVNITSKGEVLINGAQRTVIKSDQIIFEPTLSQGVSTINGYTQPQGTSVGVNGNFHVNGNTILNGGLMLDGELGLLHVTAPFEWHLTEPAKPIKTTTAIKYCSGDVESHVHYIMPHQHYFQNLPIDFLPSKEYVRWAMLNINTTDTQIMSAASLMIMTSADALTGEQIVFNNPWHQGSTNNYVLSSEGSEI